MVISGIMNMSRIHPDEIFRWFMEMFVDSADWVMVPNVYGMGTFSDGGVFATKPLHLRFKLHHEDVKFQER